MSQKDRLFIQKFLQLSDEEKKREIKNMSIYQIVLIKAASQQFSALKKCC